MSVGTALSVRLLVYAGLSLFIINGPYVYMVVCVVYTYNLTSHYTNRHLKDHAWSKLLPSTKITEIN